jgi:hypothetical protein
VKAYENTGGCYTTSWDTTPILPPADQRQITIAAFLNAFIAWETFLEQSLVGFMTGDVTLAGTSPTRYVAPSTPDAARAMLAGVNRYFAYGNQEHVRKIAGLFFENGYPYEPHLSAIVSDLADLKTMRNASAHISSTTQTALESLALRIFKKPVPAITLYQMLTSVDPRSPAGHTVYLMCRETLEVAAELIVQG